MGPKLLLGVNILFSFQEVAFHLITKAHHEICFKNSDPLPNLCPWKQPCPGMRVPVGWEQIGLLGQSAAFTIHKRRDPWFE